MCLSKRKPLHLTFIPERIDETKKVFSPFLQGMRRLWFSLFLNLVTVLLMQHSSEIKEKSPGVFSFLFWSGGCCFNSFGLVWGHWLAGFVGFVLLGLGWVFCTLVWFWLFHFVFIKLI